MDPAGRTPCRRLYIRLRGIEGDLQGHQQLGQQHEMLSGSSAKSCGGDSGMYPPLQPRRACLSTANLVSGSCASYCLLAQIVKRSSPTTVLPGTSRAPSAIANTARTRHPSTTVKLDIKVAIPLRFSLCRRSFDERG